jgi:hypothetical protein
MKNREVVIYSFILLVISLSLASSIESSVEIRTSASYGVVMKVLNHGTSDVVDTKYGKSDNQGKAEIKFETGKEKVSLMILTVYNSEIVETKKVDTVISGEKIVVKMKDAVDEITNSNQTTNITQQENQTSTIIENKTQNTINTTLITETNPEVQKIQTPGITGKTIFSTFSSSWKYALYFAIIVVGSMFFLFMSRRIKKRKVENELINEIKENREKRKLSVIEEIENAEKKISEAKKEIDSIKDFERRRAEARLQRLKGNEQEIKSNENPQNNIQNNQKPNDSNNFNKQQFNSGN